MSTKSAVILVHGVGGKEPGEMFYPSGKQSENWLKIEEKSDFLEKKRLKDIGKNYTPDSYVGMVGKDTDNNVYIEYIWHDNRLTFKKFWNDLKSKKLLAPFYFLTSLPGIIESFIVSFLGLVVELPRIAEVTLETEKKGKFIQKLCYLYRHFVIGLLIPSQVLIFFILSLLLIFLRIFGYELNEAYFYASRLSLIFYYAFIWKYYRWQQHFKIERAIWKKAGNEILILLMCSFIPVITYFLKGFEASNKDELLEILKDIIWITSSLPFLCLFLALILCIYKLIHKKLDIYMHKFLQQKLDRQKKYNNIWQTTLLSLSLSSLLRKAFFCFSWIILTSIINPEFNKFTTEQVIIITWWFLPLSVTIVTGIIFFAGFSIYIFLQRKKEEHGGLLENSLLSSLILTSFIWAIFNIFFLVFSIHKLKINAKIETLHALYNNNTIGYMYGFAWGILIFFLFLGIFFSKILDFLRDAFWYVGKKASRRGNSLFASQGLENLEELVRICVKSGYKNIILVAHSQGSILCYDMLRKNQIPHNIKLVTFGSPLRSLYIRFLSSKKYSFPPAGIADWINMYYHGDIVGREIGVLKTDMPIEGPGTHIDYWGKEEIKQEIDAMLK